jgi:hypothetical protein
VGSLESLDVPLEYPESFLMVYERRFDSIESVSQG